MNLTKKIKEIIFLNTSKSVSKWKAKKYISDPEFPYLISFPRTGSHWLRMLMELYFEKPALTRTFYYKKSKKYTCYHTHDLDLVEKRQNVLYLYRNPVDVIFSQMNYHKEDLNDNIRVRYWSVMYGLHLEKWLILENFTDKKCIVKYEYLKNDLVEEFKKVCKFFNEELDRKKLLKVSEKVSKEEVSKKTKHDNDVINLKEQYELKRKKFHHEYASYINDSVFHINTKLKDYLG